MSSPPGFREECSGPRARAQGVLGFPPGEVHEREAEGGDQGGSGVGDHDGPIVECSRFRVSFWRVFIRLGFHFENLEALSNFGLSVRIVRLVHYHVKAVGELLGDLAMYVAC